MYLDVFLLLNPHLNYVCSVLGLIRLKKMLLVSATLRSSGVGTPRLAAEKE